MNRVILTFICFHEELHKLIKYTSCTGRLRTTGSPRSDRANAIAPFCDFSFCDDVGFRSTPDLTKRLGATPY